MKYVLLLIFLSITNVSYAYPNLKNFHDNNYLHEIKSSGSSVRSSSSPRQSPATISRTPSATTNSPATNNPPSSGRDNQFTQQRSSQTAITPQSAPPTNQPTTSQTITRSSSTPPSSSQSSQSNSTSPTITRSSPTPPSSRDAAMSQQRSNVVARTPTPTFNNHRNLYSTTTTSYRPNIYYSNNNWKPRPYVNNVPTSYGGRFDGLMWWMMLDTFTDVAVLVTLYNYSENNEFKLWKAHAEEEAKRNEELRKQLDELNRKFDELREKGQIPNQQYESPILSTVETTNSSNNSFSMWWIIIPMMLGGLVLVILYRKAI